MSLIRDIVDLLDRGFVPYGGTVPETVYQERHCRTPKRAEWFVRPWSETHRHSRYMCLGCRRRCTVVDPAGWQLLLPVTPTRPSTVVFAPATPLTADELLRIKKVLRADEAAWVLNISRNVVYEMIQDGRLDALGDTPVRVTRESVLRRLEPVTP